MISISHDLGAISDVADRVLILNKAKMADQGRLDYILTHAQPPYTRLLT